MSAEVVVRHDRLRSVKDALLEQIEEEKADKKRATDVLHGQMGDMGRAYEEQETKLRAEQDAHLSTQARLQDALEENGKFKESVLSLTKEAEEARDNIEQLEKNAELEKIARSADKATHDDVSKQLATRVAELEQELAEIRANAEETQRNMSDSIANLQTQCDHNEKMHTMEVNAHKRSRERHDREITDLKRENESQRQNLAEELKAAERLRAELQAKVDEAEVQKAQQRLHHEEKYSAYEKELRRTLRDEMKTKIQALETSIDTIQQDREGLRKESQRQHAEYDALKQHADKQQEQYDEWMKEGKTRLESAESEVRKLDLQVARLEGEGHQKEQHIQSQLLSLSEAAKQQKSLRKAQSATLDKLHSSHSEELAKLEKIIRQRERLLMGASEEVRRLEQSLAKSQELNSKQEEAVNGALGRLQAAFPSMLNFGKSKDGMKENVTKKLLLHDASSESLSDRHNMAMRPAMDRRRHKKRRASGRTATIGRSDPA